MTAEESLNPSKMTTLFEAVASPCRIRALQVLKEANSSVTLTDLTREIVRKENASEEAPVEERVEKLRISLYHRHVPKLEDMGFVEWDRDDDRVAIDDSAPVERIELREP